MNGQGAEVTFRYLSGIAGDRAEPVIAALRLGGDAILLCSWESTFAAVRHKGFIGRRAVKEDGFGHIIGMFASGELDSNIVGGGSRVIWQSIGPVCWTFYPPLTSALHWVPNLLCAMVPAADMYTLNGELKAGDLFTTAPVSNAPKIMDQCVEVILAP